MLAGGVFGSVTRGGVMGVDARCGSGVTTGHGCGSGADAGIGTGGGVRGSSSAFVGDGGAAGCGSRMVMLGSGGAATGCGSGAANSVGRTDDGATTSPCAAGRALTCGAGATKCAFFNSSRQRCP